MKFDEISSDRYDRLTDVIPDLSSLNVLNTLIVSNNTLSGNFPETMDAVKSLTYLDISNNLLSGDFTEISIYNEPDIV